MSSRRAAYDAFVAGRPGDSEYLDEIKAKRAQVDKQLWLARLQSAPSDYNLWLILKGTMEGQKLGDIQDKYQTVTFRVGWVRWQELRQRLDVVDKWISAPNYQTKQTILEEVSVLIPDQIDYELDAWGKTKKLVGDTVDSLASSAAPYVIIALAFGAYALIGKKK